MAGFLSDLVQYRKLVLMILVLGIGGTHLSGFQMSVINYTSPYIQQFINQTWLERYGSVLQQETLTFLWSCVVSVYCVGGMLGCLCSGYLAAKYGKNTYECPCSVCWGDLTQEAAWICKCDLLCVSCTRKSCSKNSWITKGDKAGCLKAMKQLWGEGNYHTEFDDMMKEKAVTKGTKIMNVLEVLKERSVFPQLSTMLLILLSLQLCGLSAITFYTSEIFRTASVQESIIPYVSLGVSISEIISIIFCSSIIDRFGRRLLLWGGYLLMALILVLLEMSLLLRCRSAPLCRYHTAGYFWPSTVFSTERSVALDQFLWMRYCSVILIFLFIIAYGIGPAGAVISVTTEIFTLSTRSSAFVIGGIVIWLGLTFTGMLFPFAVMLLGPFCFLIFIAVLVISAILIYLFLPETKGKSISEITEEFKTCQFKKKRHQTVEKNSTEEKTFCTRL
ncbi:solute carrier family 2, facilitated glucose transporter member 9-like isoform X4 [Heliangelus exortis]|uniref:solute carrier family 2, facilitated glucose transporter member 9-like isoform X4 n=1 Tax=Heliangelus exortis TaxID=472823 RepID=UPI003A954AE1